MTIVSDELENLRKFLRKKLKKSQEFAKELIRRDRSGKFRNKDDLLDCAQYVKMLFGCLLGLAYAKMRTEGLLHLFMGLFIVGSAPLFLMQTVLGYAPEKTIEWGGPFAMFTDGIGAGIASLILSWASFHTYLNVETAAAAATDA